MPLSWLEPVLLEQDAGDDELMLRTELQKQAPVVIAVAKFRVYLGLLSTVPSLVLLLRSSLLR